MSRETDRKRTVEARLDKLKQRASRVLIQGNAERELLGVVKGTLDLLSDVLLEDEQR